MSDSHASTGRSLRDDALAIFSAAVEAVRGDRLLQDAVRVEDGLLWIAEDAFELSAIDRILVVGAGKASASMAAGLEAALGPEVMQAKQVTGWVNVPAGAARPLSAVHLHPARPDGVNEPTDSAVEGTRHILEIVRSAQPSDLVIALISGGGSALLPAPRGGLSLTDKIQTTRFLSRAGANIADLNAVRRQLSDVKGGGLLRACRAGVLVTLVLSDVLGDPLDTIASGPTVPPEESIEQQRVSALAVLTRFDPDRRHVPANVWHLLEEPVAPSDASSPARSAPPRPSTSRSSDVTCEHYLHVVGNLATAVDAAGREADRLGYDFALESATSLEGSAESIGARLAGLALQMRAGFGPRCLISGGEPVVTLPADGTAGRGGRNQQLVLAAGAVLVEGLAMPDRSPATGAAETSSAQAPSFPRIDQPPPLRERSELPIVTPESLHRAAESLAGADLVILSGGTDGEDGPTDAAGGLVDRRVLAAWAEQARPVSDHLTRCDAYPVLVAGGGLVRTGPTGTNVCDVRVILVDRA